MLSLSWSLLHPQHIEEARLLSQALHLFPLHALQLLIQKTVILVPHPADGPFFHRGLHPAVLLPDMGTAAEAAVSLMSREFRVEDCQPLLLQVEEPQGAEAGRVQDIGALPDGDQLGMPGGMLSPLYLRADLSCLHDSAGL